MTFTRFRWVTGMLLAMISLGAQTAVDDSGDASAIQECLLKQLESAKREMTVGELRDNCEKTVKQVLNGKTEQQAGPMTPVQDRMFNDKVNAERSYIISTFKPNYFIGTYSDKPNDAPFRPLNDGRDILDNEEAKFQVSIKAPFWRNIRGSNVDLIGAYTSTSWWQINNDDISSAFRETNYEPEIFLRRYGGPELFGGQVAALDLGLNHQSNGRSDPLSRSWNRIMGRAYLDFDDWAVALRAWYRIPDDEVDDDNPNEYRYLGYGDVLVAWAPNKHTFTAMVRPGTEEFGTEFTWSYPINKVFRVYAQYWNGYGESLLDYDQRVQRIGIGIALNDYIQRR